MPSSLTSSRLQGWSLTYNDKYGILSLFFLLGIRHCHIDLVIFLLQFYTCHGKGDGKYQRVDRSTLKYKLSLLSGNLQKPRDQCGSSV